MEYETENGTDSPGGVAGGEAMAMTAGVDSSRIIGAASGLAGLVGNFMVCLVLLRYRAVFSSVANRLMLHQSLVDLLLSGVMLLTRLYTPWGEFYCRVPRGWLYWGLANVSTASLVLICCDRYVAICRPIKYRRWFSAGRVKAGLGLVWLLPVAWQSYLVFVHLPAGDACVASWGTDAARLAWGVATFCWEYLVPLGIIFFTYGNTLASLRRRLRAKAVQAASEPSAAGAAGAGGARAPAVARPRPKDPLETAKVKLTVTFLVVAVFFVVCWGPTEVTWLLFNFGLLPGSYYSSVWHLGVETPLLCLNTCVNPVIYCVTYTHFRRKAFRLFCRCSGGAGNRVGPNDSLQDNPTENSTEPDQPASGSRGNPTRATTVASIA